MATKPTKKSPPNEAAVGKDVPMTAIRVVRVICPRCYNEFSPEEIDDEFGLCPYCDQHLVV